MPLLDISRKPGESDPINLRPRAIFPRVWARARPRCKFNITRYFLVARNNTGDVGEITTTTTPGERREKSEPLAPARKSDGINFPGLAGNFARLTNCRDDRY